MKNNLRKFDIYPSFYEVVTGRVIILFPLTFTLLMLVPFLFDSSIILDDNQLDMMLGPMLIYFFACLIEMFVLNNLVKKYVKPFRLTSSAIYIPNWLWERELIIPRCKVDFIEIHGYEVYLPRVGVIKQFKNVCIFTTDGEIYKLSIGNAPSGDLSALSLLEYDLRYIELNNPLNYQLFCQLRYSRVHLILFSFVFFLTAISFGKLLY